MVNNYIVEAELSHLSNAASRRVPSRWAVDAEEVAGVEIVLLCALPNVSAEFASWALRSRESLGRTPSRSGRRWQAVAGRRSVILQRPVLQSCFDPGLVPQLQFIDRVDSVRDGVLLVLSSDVHRDRYPQLLSFSLGLWLLQHIDKIVDVPVDAVALWRLVTEFHIFSSCCSRSSPGIWTIFPEPLVSGSHLPLCVATVHGCAWKNFVYFLPEKWTRISLQFTLGNLELFLRAVSGSHRVRQSTLLL